MIQRNTLHLLGGAALQRLADEMTKALFDIRAAAGAEACKNNQIAIGRLSPRTWISE